MSATPTKPVWYYCPSCRKYQLRQVTRASAKRPSFCGSTGKNVMMRKVCG